MKIKIILNDYHYQGLIIRMKQIPGCKYKGGNV